jgi:hypothetical protein
MKIRFPAATRLAAALTLGTALFQGSAVAAPLTCSEFFERGPAAIHAGGDREPIPALTKVSGIDRVTREPWKFGKHGEASVSCSVAGEFRSIRIAAFVVGV